MIECHVCYLLACLLLCLHAELWKNEESTIITVTGGVLHA